MSGKGRVGGRLRATAATRVRGSGARRFILTSAQNNTAIYQDAWYNLLALADYYDAKVLVARFTYNKSRFGRKSVKPGDYDRSDYDDLWYAPEIAPYVSDERLELAPGLVWCGELNILPTATDPLSQLEAYTGRASSIVPHAKFAMWSVASAKYEPTKFLYSTGTVTLRNYIKKKAGLKAEPVHGYGGLLVEVAADGAWFVRQLEAAHDGSIRDLDLLARHGVVTGGHRIEAVHWGDVHHRFLDPSVRRLAWGEGGMLDALQPRYQFIEDVIDFRSRNHHERGNPHAAFQKFVTGGDSVEAEIAEAADWLRTEVTRPWCETLVVDSNHDRALERWLREADPREDPVNVRFYLEASLALYGAIATRDRTFHTLGWAMRRTGELPGVHFLHEDEGFVLCRRFSGGIEAGMHGHLGPNGRPGSIKAFAKMGRRTNTAHAHWAGIYHGSWQAGTSTLLDLGYNRGPSNWSHSHVLTYPEGTRSMVTMWKGRWRA